MSDVKRLLDEATPLPWTVVDDRNNSESLTISNDFSQAVVHDYCHGCGGIDKEQDAALIVHAVNHLPDYEAAVDALERIIEMADGFDVMVDPTSEWAQAIEPARAALRRLRADPWEQHKGKDELELRALAGDR